MGIRDDFTHSRLMSGSHSIGRSTSNGPSMGRSIIGGNFEPRYGPKSSDTATTPSAIHSPSLSVRRRWTQLFSSFPRSVSSLPQTSVSGTIDAIERELSIDDNRFAGMTRMSPTTGCREPTALPPLLVLDGRRPGHGQPLG